jgi:hypothetical protein
VQATVLPDGNYYLPATDETIPAEMATPQRRTGPAISANEETRCAEVPQDGVKRGTAIILMKKKFETNNRTI